MANYPHGLTKGWSAEELALAREMIIKLIPYYRSVPWYMMLPFSKQRAVIVGLLRYALAAVGELEQQHKEQ